jgi:cell division protein FtsB
MSDRLKKQVDDLTKENKELREQIHDSNDEVSV